MYGVRLCSFTTVPDVRRGKWRWEFSEQFGPTFLGKNGDPLKNQPSERSPAWAAFNEWHKEYRASKGKCGEHCDKPMGHAGMHGAE